MAKVYLSLGSNQGDRLDALVRAAQMVDLNIGNVELNSMVVESEPWGFNSDVPFYNLVLVAETQLLPARVLERILEIETEMGRTRTGNTYMDRIIDIDILFYDHDIVDTENLVIPHPRMHNRRFVLDPLAAIAPGFVHPVLKATVKELLEIHSDQGKVSLAVDANQFAGLLRMKN